MLPQRQRIRHPDQFRAIVRRGVKVNRRTLVMHALTSDASASRAGFVVSKAVGDAVARNRVKRRLRHLARGRIDAARRPIDVVVRALPTATTGDLAGDFESAWDAAAAKLEAL